ncbi:hypothetical protein [Sulfuriferula nivalis]|uniref:Carboxypeptidase regulatory-like domain-containing protein n=1 Tax=Sulfuriferula nivalis TaxID=2675298 RepID=A0A809S9N5_9PROT|nr:hypothetical protein [Sulfuriferula nivalis]BBP01393.1 hypothetical protein SFSGTM_21010 [Sulfuriferula nivalis]
MKLKIALLLASTLCVATPLTYADDASANFVNGGIGVDEQTMMHNVANEYPLHIEFSKSERGTFLADIPVSIKDSHGKVVFELKDAGPMLYVRLPKGTYTVNAVFDGEAQSGKVTLDGKHNKRVVLHWKRPADPITKDTDE